MLFILTIFIPILNVRSEPGAERPKIGLVLSGGGAKGFAHIGILKLLDSLQIPVDYIAGTSMGSIAGGLYAIGYSGFDLEKIAERDDWQEIFTDNPPRPMLPFFQKEQTGRYQLDFGIKGLKPVTPSGLIFGQKISLLFSSLTFPYEKITDFDRLPIPFRCVAVDLVTGNSVVLKSGSLAKALRASMSIPTVFSPVEWGDSLLVDGGLINNLPVDVVREMGADIVIAVDVQSPLLERERLNSVLNVLEQTVSIVGLDLSRANASQADIYITPDISAFSASDFDKNKIKQICRRGDEAAWRSIPLFVALKEKYKLGYADTVHHELHTKAYRIFGVQIIGHTTIPFGVIYEQLNIKPNDPFDPIAIQKRFAEMKTLGNYESIRYDVVPMNDQYVRLLIRVGEKQQPQIMRVALQGNSTLPGAFIYRLLGLKPGDPLNTDYLNRRITELYALGYFELIQYEIEPVTENRVILVVKMRELPLRRLRVGLRYDDQYKLVAAVSMQATNLLLPGLRVEDELQFAGLTRFRAKVFYPARALDFPVYPFLQASYRDIPTPIFDGFGHRIAEYADRATTAEFGLGLVLYKSLNAELAYQREWMNIKPNIAFTDPAMFPSWKDELRKLEMNLCLDLLDDVLIPRKGILMRGQYEGSIRQLHSDLYYQRASFSIDWYHTRQRKHTFRFSIFAGRSSGNLPVYKYFFLGTQNCFVGMQNSELFGNALDVLRLDYRYEYKKDIFLKLIANGAFNLENKAAPAGSQFLKLFGIGGGITLISPVGPIEFIVSRGDRNIVPPRKWQTMTYFTLGYKF
ncbi:patatin-like phospholipase family protein [candidate division KSB1 bacterium]|nr:patatin-like phospholipase family protein [candidate division KSB1 bacterium]